MIISESEKNRIKSLHGLIVEKDDREESHKDLLRRIKYLKDIGHDVDLRGFDKGIISTNGKIPWFNFFSKNEKKTAWYDQDNNEVPLSTLSSDWSDINVEEKTFGVGDYENYQDFVSNIFPNKWLFTDNKSWFDSYVDENKEFRVKRKTGYNPKVLVKSIEGKRIQNIDLPKKRTRYF